MCSKHAFTLAETIIAIAIIGIVAAITIPSVAVNYKEKAAAVKLKKTFSILQSAYSLAVRDCGGPVNWNLMSSTTDDDGNIDNQGVINLGEIFAQYMKVAKNCGTETGCWYSTDMYYLRGESIPDTYHIEFRENMYKFNLNDGTMLAFGITSESCEEYRGSTDSLSHVCGWAAVDVNGNLSPNTYGKDIFEFVITKNEILPYGLPDDERFSFDKYCNSSTAGGNGCTAWVIYNENMDYLKCDDLSWDGKKSCNK